MAFVNEYTSQEDREFYRLAEFEKKIYRVIPSPDWAIDREQDIFLRVITNDARKDSPDDPNAFYEKDYQFHWKGYEYLVETSLKGDDEFERIPKEVFQSSKVFCANKEGAIALKFHILSIEEMEKPTPDAPSALQMHRQQVLSDLEYVLAFSFGGGFARLTPKASLKSRYVMLKISS